MSLLHSLKINIPYFFNIFFFWLLEEQSRTGGASFMLCWFTLQKIVFRTYDLIMVVLLLLTLWIQLFLEWAINTTFGLIMIQS